MARPTGQGGAGSVLRAAERLVEINREVAEILRVFPDLRSCARSRPIHMGIARLTRRHTDQCSGGVPGGRLLH